MSLSCAPFPLPDWGVGKIEGGDGGGGRGAGAWERLLFAWALPGVAKTASPWQKKKLSTLDSGREAKSCI